MVSWIIEGALAASARPGYAPGAERAARLAEVEAWIAAAQKAGVRAIICLLGNDQLPLYVHAVPEGLLARYRAAGFEVAHIATRDGQTEPFTQAQLAEAWAAFRRLPQPVLVHCSAGHDRTGRVTRHILKCLDLETERPRGA